MYFKQQQRQLYLNFTWINSAFSKIWSRCLPLLAPGRADKRGPKAPFPLVENAGIQPVICKRVPTRAPAGAGSHWKHWINKTIKLQ